MIHPKKNVNSKDFQKIQGYKTSAYEEYKAARTLFNTEQLKQACILANTAIERELKVFLLYFGKPSASHDVFDLYNKAVRISPGLRQLVNPEFIKLIAKIYKSRYTENISPGYNFQIVQNKFLAELDQTYKKLEDMTIVGMNDEDDNLNKYNNLYRSEIESKNSQLWENNYILNNIEKEDFLAQRDNVLELRVGDNHHIYTAKYSIPYNPDDRFNHKALNITSIIKDDVMLYELEIVYKQFLIESSSK